MKRLLWCLLMALLAFFITLVIISESKSSRQIKSECSPSIPEVLSGFEERLTKAIRIRTISHIDRKQDDTAAFMAFHQLLKENFPLIHSSMELLKINDFALIYILNGADPELKPIVLTAHQDVVPISDSISWEQPPFSGFNDGTFVWGRGTLDDKGSLMGILEAMELLLQNKFKPKRTIIFAFGCDEEINGEFGAYAISKYLEKYHIYPELVLDEGLVMTHGMVPMLDKPAALVGIAEKGFLILKLTTEMDGGHSSMPNKENAITILSEAVFKINNYSFSTRLCDPVRLFMDYVGPEMNFFPRLIFNNHWFFAPAIKQVYLSFPEGQASVRTTAVPTVFHAGIKDNIIPQVAEALINFRILPGETIESTIEMAEKIIDDKRIMISVYEQPFEPPAISSVSGLGFTAIMHSIKEEFPDAIVVPYLMLGSSDARHYYNICKNIYRFAPYELTSDDMTRIHGSNERISIENYRNMIGFYYRLIYNSCQ